MRTSEQILGRAYATYMQHRFHINQWLITAVLIAVFVIVCVCEFQGRMSEQTIDQIMVVTGLLGLISYATILYLYKYKTQSRTMRRKMYDTILWQSVMIILPLLMYPLVLLISKNNTVEFLFFMGFWVYMMCATQTAHGIYLVCKTIVKKSYNKLLESQEQRAS